MTDIKELTPDVQARADKAAKFIAERTRELISFVLGPEFEFALIVNDPSVAQRMAIFSELNTQAELTALLRLAYTRHDDGTMFQGGELKEPKH